MTLKTLFEEQLSLLDELLELLGDEQQQLSLQKPEGTQLESIAGKKKQKLLAIESLEHARLKVQVSLGYENNQRGTEAAAEQAQCLPTWQKLQHAARRVQRLNHINGDLIQLRLSANQKILNFVREVREIALYGPDGQSGKGSRLLHSSA